MAGFRRLMDEPDSNASQGDVYYADASGNTARLAAGTSGYFLKTQGAGANPVWAVAGVTDHGALTGLTGTDHHTQYALLAPASSTRNVIQPTAATYIPLTLKGYTSQSANLTEWQNSSGTILGRVDSAGRFVAPDGTLSLPSVRFASSSTTGLYYSSGVAVADGSGYSHIFSNAQLNVGSGYNLAALKLNSKQALNSGSTYLIAAADYTNLYLSPSDANPAANIFFWGENSGTPAVSLGRQGNATFNEQGNAVDFRIESDTVSNMFFVQGSTDRIGIGTASPSERLDMLDGDILLSRTSSTSKRSTFQVTASLPTSTDASRTGRAVFSVLDYGGTRAPLTLEANGTRALVGINVGSATPTAGLQVATDIAETAVITPTALAANTDNWNPTSLGTSRHIRIGMGGGSYDLTGVTAQTAGFRLTIWNIDTTGTLTLKHDATSTAANRFYCPNNADVAVRPNGSATIWYDITSARWRVLTERQAVLPRGHIDGLTLSINVTDPNNDIDIAAGVACSDSTDPVMMRLASALTKQLDASWAVGTGNGGLDTGSEANSTWYHIWLIQRSDTGVVDALFSTSASSPTMPANYDRKRRIGSVRNNSSGNLVAFSQIGDVFLWKSPVEDVAVTNLASASGTLFVMTVPTGVTVGCLCSAYAPTSGENSYLSSPNITDEALSASGPTRRTLQATASSHSDGEILTDTSAQIRARGGSANTDLNVTTRGWRDPRGRNA